MEDVMGIELTPSKGKPAKIPGYETLIFQWLVVKRPIEFSPDHSWVCHLWVGWIPMKDMISSLRSLFASFCNIFTVSLAMNCHGRSFPLHEWPAMSSIPLEYIGIRSINMHKWNSMDVCLQFWGCKKFSNPQTSNVFGIFTRLPWLRQYPWALGHPPWISLDHRFESLIGR